MMKLLPLLLLTLVLSVGVACSTESASEPITASTPTAGPTAIATTMNVLPRATATITPPVSAVATVVPSVSRLETYEVRKTTHVYGRGFSSPSWDSSSKKPMDLLIDVYEPVGAPIGRPLFVFIHGGGFFGGTREGGPGAWFSKYFAARGFVAASIDYRLAKHYGTIPVNWSELVTRRTPEGRKTDQRLAMYPAARDTKAALRWLVAEQNRFGINLEFVTVAGGSAGAFLAVMAGVSNDGDFVNELDVLSDPTLRSTNLDKTIEVDTVLEFMGGAAHLEMLELIDGENRFEADVPALMIVHGTEDSTVPYTSAETLVAYYEAAGAEYVFHPIVGGGHSVWNKKIDGKSLVELGFDYVLETQNLDFPIN